MDNATWTEVVHCDYEITEEGRPLSEDKYISYSLRGDTIFDGLRRSKLYCCPDIEQDYSELIGFIHEEKGKVYFRHQKGLGWSSDYLDLCEQGDIDILLYDFTLEKDAIYPGCETMGKKVFLSEIDMIALGNIERRRFCFSSIPDPVLGTLTYNYIEGMGSPRNLFETIEYIAWSAGCRKRLICFSQNDEVLWLSPDFKDCPLKKGNGANKIETTDREAVSIHYIAENRLIVSSLPMQPTTNL
ncbi:hypothetical protein AGMMS4957_16710 [Bacteroidia bacterium]|nr:hypothetical protein AGMMS4957_16710 [Bacteroidia bacterium]